MQLPNFNIYPLKRDVTKVWFVKYKDPASGKNIKVYGHFTQYNTLRDKLNEAKRIITSISISLNLPPFKTDPYPAIDVPKLIQQKLEERSIGLRSKSITTYQTKVIEFVRWYRLYAHKPEIAAAGIGISFIKFLKEGNRSNTTVNSYRTTLKSLFKSLKKEIIVNPFDDTLKLKERRKSYLYFDKDLQQMLRKIMIEEDPELWLACQCQYYLLLRPNELRTIKIGAFNLRSTHVRVEGDISKNSYTQSIIIPDEFIEQLSFVKNYPPDYYLFSKGGKPGLVAHNKKFFPDRHRAILKRHNINVRDYKFYSWKHTGAVMYYLATGDVKGLKEQGRWHSLDMVNEYLKNLGVMDIERVRLNYPKIGSQT